MSAEDERREDAPKAPSAIVKRMVELTRTLQNLDSDMRILRSRIDSGSGAEHLRHAVLSATLFAADLIQELVRMRIDLTEEGD